MWEGFNEVRGRNKKLSITFFCTSHLFGNNNHTESCLANVIFRSSREGPSTRHQTEPEIEHKIEFSNE